MKIANVVKVGAGQGAPQGSQWFNREGYPFIRAANLDALCSDGHYGSLERVTAAAAAEYRLRLYPPDTIVFAKSGMSATKNRVFRLTRPAYVVNHLATLEPSSQISPTFFRYWLESFNPSRLIQDSAYPSISQEDIEDVEINLPPLGMQNTIAGRLDRADRLRRMRRYALQMSDGLLPAAFLQMFGDPIRNTKGWSVSELEELATVERGKFTPRPRNDPTYYGGNFPFIQTGDISDSGGRVCSWTQTLNEKGVKVSRSFPRGTIVIAIVGATIGRTAILEIEVFCPDSVVGIQVDPDQATKEYMEFVLRLWRPIFLAQAPETARANINLDTLRPLRIPVPPLPLQQKFTVLVDRYELIRSVQLEALRQADHLFQKLLHEAFCGY